MITLVSHKGKICARTGNKTKGFGYKKCAVIIEDKKIIKIMLPKTNRHKEMTWELNEGNTFLIDDDESRSNCFLYAVPVY